MKQQTILAIITVVITLVIAAASATYKIPRWQEELTSSQMKAHKKERINEAHPDAKDRFVDKEQFGDSLHEIDSRLMKIEIMQQQILQKLER